MKHRLSSGHTRAYTVGVFIVLLVLAWYSYTTYTYMTTKVANPASSFDKIKNIDTGGNVEDKPAPNDTSLPPGLYASIKDEGFVAFATTIIEKRCPYYKPDGATYRECLGDWEQELANKLITEQQDEVHSYCSTFTVKYATETSFEGQELFLKCAIYKFQ